MTAIHDFLNNRDAAADFSRCRPYLEAALERTGGTHTIMDIAAGVELGQFHFWPGRECAVVTEVHVWPRARFLHVFLAGGDLDEIISMIPLFKSWGRYLGCTELTETGRLGWERVLAGQGWKKRAVVLSTPIGPETAQ